MKIKVHTKPTGFMSASNDKISTIIVKIVDEEGKELGILSGDELRDQLSENSYEIFYNPYGPQMGQ